MEKKLYSVFHKQGDEANDELLSFKEAAELAHKLEADGYEVIIAKLDEKSNQWVKEYETDNNPNIVYVAFKEDYMPHAVIRTYSSKEISKPDMEADAINVYDLNGPDIEWYIFLSEK